MKILKSYENIENHETLQKLNARIKKKIAIIRSYARTNKKHENHIISFINFENNGTPWILHENLGNHKKYIIPYKNHGNHENHKKDLQEKWKL